MIIKPQFELVTSFHNGKAIISAGCKTEHSNDVKNHEICCHNNITKCTKYGYINENGTILKIGDYTFREISQEIKLETVVTA